MFLLIMALLSAMMDWYALAKGWKKLEYLLKPVTMVFLFSWLIAVSSLNEIAFWFGLGLLFSLAGDIFMMLPKEQFVAALISFLIAHVMYSIGFNPSLPPFPPLGLFFVVFIAAIGKEIYRHVSAGLEKQGKTTLQKPVLVYIIIIAAMQISALFTLFRADWSLDAALTVSLGAGLFMLSDAILAWLKFVEPIKYGRVKNTAAYHLGQIVLIVGVWMQMG